MASTYGVAATVTAVVGLAEADLVLNGKPPVMRPVIGGAILGVFLFAVAELDPRLGTLFGILIVVNAVMVHGPTVFAKVYGKKG